MVTKNIACSSTTHQQQHWIKIGEKKTPHVPVLLLEPARNIKKEPISHPVNSETPQLTIVFVPLGWLWGVSRMFMWYWGLKIDPWNAENCGNCLNNPWLLSCLVNHPSMINGQISIAQGSFFFAGPRHAKRALAVAPPTKTPLPLRWTAAVYQAMVCLHGDSFDGPKDSKLGYSYGPTNSLFLGYFRIYFTIDIGVIIPSITVSWAITVRN